MRLSFQEVNVDAVSSQHSLLTAMRSPSQHGPTAGWAQLINIAVVSLAMRPRRT